MGAHIISFAEVKIDGEWRKLGNLFPSDVKNQSTEVRYNDRPFGFQSYALFGFLAGVRNFSQCDSIQYDLGMPGDSDQDIVNAYLNWEEEALGPYYASLKTLLEFDYSKKFENQREGSITKGKQISYREHLGELYFIHLDILKDGFDPAITRIIYWFI